MFYAEVTLRRCFSKPRSYLTANVPVGLAHENSAPRNADVTHITIDTPPLKTANNVRLPVPCLRELDEFIMGFECEYYVSGMRGFMGRCDRFNRGLFTLDVVNVVDVVARH